MQIYGIPKSTLLDKVNGRRPLVAKAGPDPVLTQDKEQKLATWCAEMANIGYGQTRNELLNMVKRILDNDPSRESKFINNRPGKDWFYAFLKRNPRISERMTLQLGKERAIVSPNMV